MTKFHLALVIGFFIGALTTFLVLGIIQIYVEEREEKNPLARKRTSRESRDAGGCHPIPIMGSHITSLPLRLRNQRESGPDVRPRHDRPPV
jgi:hypothetical protein